MEEIPEIKAEWISYKAAMKITGLSRGTLWRLTKDGFIPASKQGRAVRLHRKSIDALMWRGTEVTVAGTDLSESGHFPEDR
jgi:excisionase family DNA binding protein